MRVREPVSIYAMQQVDVGNAYAGLYQPENQELRFSTERHVKQAPAAPRAARKVSQMNKPL